MKILRILGMVAVVILVLKIYTYDKYRQDDVDR